jgi:hypothetical protein
MSYPRLQVPLSGKESFTDYSRWRLLVNDGGRHTWHYLKTDDECARWPQNSVDKYWLGLPVVISLDPIVSYNPLKCLAELAYPTTNQRPAVFRTEWVRIL